MTRISYTYSMKTILIFFIFILIANFNLFAQEKMPLPNVQFMINENYLVTHSLSKGAYGKYADDIVSLQNLAWDMDQTNYRTARSFGKHNIDIFDEAKIPVALLLFIKKVKATPEFKKVLIQTQDYLNESLKEWNENLSRSTTFMTSISGLDFIKGLPFTVYITHPASGNGTTWNKEQRLISFGSWATFPYYFTVYIWHEILHTYMERDDLAHSIIQLATDNALRELFNHVSYPPFEGHTYLFPTMTELLPSWYEYLKAPDSLLFFYERAKVSGIIAP